MMDEQRRQHYLDAMGIPRWRLRVAPESVAVAAPPAPEALPESPVMPGQRPAPDVAGLDWEALEARVSACTACALHETRSRTVFGSGNRTAEWMFIGEAPGAEEDRQGQPFVGPAGQLLTAMIEAMKMKREQVYIANVLKCRPPGNRDPGAEEAALCESFLLRQVALVKPKIIVALGRIAAQNLLKTDAPLSRLRGQVFQYGEQAVPLVATYHPAYLLRTPADKRKAWEDLLFAMKTLKSRSRSNSA